MNDKKWGIGLSFALNGLKTIIFSERNFKIHLFATLVVIILSAYFQLTRLEWAIILIVIAFVLISEIINSVIESLIDYVKPEIHPQAKIIKDMMAGAVLLTAILSLIIGILIFAPKIISLF